MENIASPYFCVLPEYLASWRPDASGYAEIEMETVWGLPSDELSQEKKLKTSWSERFHRTRAWRKLRKEAIELYGSICVKCGATEQIQVDHIKPKSRFPELAMEISNLQILCWPCNKRKGASLEK